MNNKKEKFIDITDDVIACVVGKYDEIGLTWGYDKILIAFKTVEKRGICELYDRMYKQFPYTANSKTALSTDASERKIRRLVNN